MTMTKLINGERVVLSQEEEDAVLAEQAIGAAEIAANLAEYEANEWIRLRLAAYAAFGEQLDKIYHDIDNECLDKTGEFYLHCKSVKDSIPKPEEE